MKAYFRTIVRLSFLMFLFSANTAPDKDIFHGDKELHIIAKAAYDSISSRHNFEKIQLDGLAKAIKRDNSFYVFTFKRALAVHKALFGKRKAFLEECDNAIYWYKENRKHKHDDAKYIYYLGALKAEYLDDWGRQNDALDEVNKMYDYAIVQGDKIGEAIVNFYLGSMYLNNRNCEEADKYYRIAAPVFESLGENDYYMRCGFRRIAIRMNLNETDRGVEICDSLTVFLNRLIAQGEDVSSVDRMKLAQYRFNLLTMEGDFKAAEAYKDTMLRYNNIYPSPIQQEDIEYSIINFEKAKANFDKAIEGYERLIDRFEKERVWGKVARYRYAYADCLRAAGRSDEAIVNYRLYANARDSANIQSTNERLNELTKKYELNELSLEKKVTQRNFYFSLAFIVFLLLALLIIISSERKLKKRNRALYEQIVKENKAFVLAETVKDAIPEQNLSPGEILFRRAQKLIVEEQLFRDENFTREILAKRLGTNTNYLISAVKTYTGGKTFTEFIDEFRLRLAAEKLADESDKTIEEIGEFCGFKSRSTFFRKFKSSYGISPLEYKIAALN